MLPTIATRVIPLLDTAATPGLSLVMPALDSGIVTDPIHWLGTSSLPARVARARQTGSSMVSA